MMRNKYFLVIVYALLLGAEHVPSYEVLPRGSIYLINSTDNDIVFLLQDNELNIRKTLTKGEHTIYRIVGPNMDSVIINITTGESTVRYRLVSEGRYVLYWNASETRFDIGIAK